MIVTEDNFILFAAKYYDNKNCCSVDEFEEDLQRFKYLRKLFYNYRNKAILRERLILNHIVILYNIFEPVRCTEMLSLKLLDYLEELLPFLDILGYTPRTMMELKEKDFFINTNIINRDEIIVSTLKKLFKNQD